MLVELLINKNSEKIENIYNLIDVIEQRTSMFIPDKSITSLFTFLSGYLAFLEIHNIIEKDVPDFNNFSKWLAEKFKWNLAYGWAYAIKQNCKELEDPLMKFFKLVKDFKKIGSAPVACIGKISSGNYSAEYEFKGINRETNSKNKEILARQAGFRTERVRLDNSVLLRIYGDTQQDVDDFILLVCQNDFQIY